eukprot:516798-Rhodomonas_salina.6
MNSLRNRSAGACFNCGQHSLRHYRSSRGTCVAPSCYLLHVLVHPFPVLGIGPMVETTCGVVPEVCNCHAAPTSALVDHTPGPSFPHGIVHHAEVFPRRTGAEPLAMSGVVVAIIVGPRSLLLGATRELHKRVEQHPHVRVAPEHQVLVANAFSSLLRCKVSLFALVRLPLIRLERHNRWCSPASTLELGILDREKHLSNISWVDSAQHAPGADPSAAHVGIPGRVNCPMQRGLQLTPMQPIPALRCLQSRVCPIQLTEAQKDMVAQRLVAVSHWPARVRFVRACPVLPLQYKVQVVGAIDCDIEREDVST